MPYKKHIFICTNKRENNKECCENHHAQEMVQYTKKKCIELNLTKEEGYRVSSSGCMGFCKKGPALVIYPEGIWYTYRNQNDIDEILTSTLLANEPVERLLID